MNPLGIGADDAQFRDVAFRRLLWVLEVHGESVDDKCTACLETFPCLTYRIVTGKYNQTPAAWAQYRRQP